MIEMMYGEDDGSHPLAFVVIAISVAIMLIIGCTNSGTIRCCGDGTPISSVK